MGTRETSIGGLPCLVGPRHTCVALALRLAQVKAQEIRRASDLVFGAFNLHEPPELEGVQCHYRPIEVPRLARLLILQRRAESEAI